MKKLGLVMGIVVPLMIGPLVMTAGAKPPYSEKEKKLCVYCHLTATGGAIGFRGVYYGAKKHSFKGFNEKRQAKLAGVKANSMGNETKPTKKYKPK